MLSPFQNPQPPELHKFNSSPWSIIKYAKQWTQLGTRLHLHVTEKTRRRPGHFCACFKWWGSIYRFLQLRGPKAMDPLPTNGHACNCHTWHTYDLLPRAPQSSTNTNPHRRRGTLTGDEEECFRRRRCNKKNIYGWIPFRRFLFIASLIWLLSSPFNTLQHLSHCIFTSLRSHISHLHTFIYT